MLYMFSKHVGIKDSNKAKVLANLEALHIYCIAYQHSLIVESDLRNAISWVKYSRGPWKMQFYFNEIMAVDSKSRVSIKHVSRLANGMVDYLAKQGVVRSCNLSAPVM